MPPLERHNLNENNHSTLEIEEIIETYKNAVDKKLNAAANVLESQNNLPALTDFKEIKETIEKNNEATLSSLKQELKKAYSLNYPYLKEKSIISAKSTYEIITRVNMKILDGFLNRYNITIDNTQ